MDLPCLNPDHKCSNEGTYTVPLTVSKGKVIILFCQVCGYKWKTKYR
jgi:hypothetical protein